MAEWWSCLAESSSAAAVASTLLRLLAPHIPTCIVLCFRPCHACWQLRQVGLHVGLCEVCYDLLVEVLFNRWCFQDTAESRESSGQSFCPFAIVIWGFQCLCRPCRGSEEPCAGHAATHRDTCGTQAPQDSRQAARTMLPPVARTARVVTATWLYSCHPGHGTALCWPAQYTPASTHTWKCVVAPANKHRIPGRPWPQPSSSTFLPCGCTIETTLCDTSHRE